MKKEDKGKRSIRLVVHKPRKRNVRMSGWSNARTVAFPFFLSAGGVNKSTCKLVLSLPRLCFIYVVEYKLVVLSILITIHALFDVPTEYYHRSIVHKKEIHIRVYITVKTHTTRSALSSSSSNARCREPR